MAFIRSNARPRRLALLAEPIDGAPGRLRVRIDRRVAEVTARLLANEGVVVTDEADTGAREGRDEADDGAAREGVCFEQRAEGTHNGLPYTTPGPRQRADRLGRE